MTWLLWLAACAGCLAVGHILGAGWPDLQVRHVLALEENDRLRARCQDCATCNPSFADLPGYDFGDHP